MKRIVPFLEKRSLTGHIGFDSVIYREHPYNDKDSRGVESMGGVVSAGGAMVLNIPVLIL